MKDKNTGVGPQKNRKRTEIPLEIVEYAGSKEGATLGIYEADKVEVYPDDIQEAQYEEVRPSLAVTVLKATVQETGKLSVQVLKLSGIAVLFVLYGVLTAATWILSALSGTAGQGLKKSTGYDMPVKPPRYTDKSINVQNNVKTGDNSNVTINQYF
jgi:hypothetical protein